jgi:aminoglycoside/choline kinase family phosphotransferase
MEPSKDVRLSSDRDIAKAAFLVQHGFGDARRQALGGDASTRAYERLHRGGESFIFMDQPPALESLVCPPNASDAERIALGYNAAARLAAGSVAAFVATAGYLRARGLSAPQILAHDIAAGLAVLEDLGDGLYATLIAEGQDETPLYEAAVDVQVALHGEAPPEVLTAEDGVTWPLLTYDTLALKIATDTFLEWWPKFAGIPSFTDAAVAEWDALWAPVWARGEAGASVFTHRDYHAQNLIWLPGRDGVARVGLLDFQDALRAHPAWDLTHLLQDARRDVSPELEAAMLDRYLTARPAVERQAFIADYRALAASNAARILGRVFARQALAGRPQYEAYMPRTWRYLERNLENPALAGLKAWFDANVPIEARR